MTANDWIVIQRARAYREGSVYGAVGGVVLGMTLMIGIHIGLATYSDRQHDKAVALIRAADRMAMAECTARLARYAEVAAVADAYDSRRVR